MQFPLSFGRTSFEKLFPFYFSFDRGLNITQLGPSLAKLKQLEKGDPLEKGLLLKRPACAVSFEEFLASLHSLFVFQVQRSELLIRGQLVHMEESDNLLFLGSPWLRSWEQLSLNYLELQDFAIHDPVTDYLTLLNTSQTTLKETQDLVRRLGHSEAETLSILATLPDKMFRITRKAVPNLFDPNSKTWREVELEDYFPAGVAHKLRQGQPDFSLLTFQMDGLEFEARICFSDEEESLILLRELTEQRASERKLLQSLPQMESAQKMEALGRLAGGIAHDFNNLLTSIVLNVTALDIPEDNKEELEDIELAAERASSLTRQLLTFSQNQVGENRLLSLNTILKSMSRIILPLLRNEIEFELKLDPNAGFVFMDQSQLEQVILNLTLNSREAMPGGGRLEVTTRCSQRGDERYTVLTVCDNGKGMSDETLKKVFEPFYSEKGSSGLGLATVYGVVTQAKGRVEVTSELGRGTEFSIFLPFHSPPQAESPSSDKATILVVEDQAPIRRSVIKHLKKAGYQTLQAGDGLEALELVQAGNCKVDLLLSDVLMPRMGGAELAQALRDTVEDLKVILMSGNPDSEMVRSGKAGEHRFLAKPFTSSKLLDSISEELSS